MRTSWLALVALVAGTASVSIAGVCSYDMQAFPESSVSCQDGKQFKCVGGNWQKIGTDCARADPGESGPKVQPGVREPAVREPSVAQPAPPSVPTVR